MRIAYDPNECQEDTDNDSESGAYDAYVEADAPQEDAAQDGAAGNKSGNKPGKSIRTLLADLVAEETSSFKTVFRSGDGHTYVRMLTTGRAETLEVKTSGDFAQWLMRRAYDDASAVPSENAVKDTVRLLEAKAANNPPQEVALRVARRGNTIYVDMANTAGRVIVVKPSGWRVVSTCWQPTSVDEDAVDARQIAFYRPSTMLPLPEPTPHVAPATLDRLFSDLLPGVSVSHRPLILMWLLGALRPGGPYPVLALQGPEGAGKSVASDLLQTLVDPSTATRRNLSSRGEPRGLFIAARSGHVLAFDNVSGQFSADQSDALCQISSGGTYASRAHYTNDDEHLVRVAKPLVVNGIDAAVTRQDLLSRTILVEMAPIDKKTRRREAAMKAAFDVLHPQLLGVLLDALVAALAAEGHETVGELPRMADVAAFILPAEHALGLTPGALRAALEQGEADVNDAAIDANPLARAVIQFMQVGSAGQTVNTKGKWTARYTWQGTLEDLAKNLAAVADDMDDTLRRSPAWPRGSVALGNHLRRSTNLLARQGITHGQTRNNSARYRVLTYTPQADTSHTEEPTDDDIPF